MYIFYVYSSFSFCVLGEEDHDQRDIISSAYIHTPRHINTQRQVNNRYTMGLTSGKYNFTRNGKYGKITITLSIIYICSLFELFDVGLEIGLVFIFRNLKQFS